MKRFGIFIHEWKLDFPWQMVHLRDWFYMVNAGYIYPTVFLHVRIFGLRSLWTFPQEPIANSQSRRRKHEAAICERLRS